MSKLTNKVAIVTGGASGIGGATARRLASDGARVIIADINEETSSQNVSKIVSDGGIAKTFIANVGVSSELRNLIQFAIDTWGQLDILVNNAYTAMSPAVRGNAVEITEDVWDESFSVLLKAHYLGTKFAVPHMIKSGGGNIVNIASVHGALAAPRALVYDTAKAAVIQMTKQMAIDFGPENIRVNAILPGHIVTETVQTNRWDLNPSGLEFFHNQYPLRKVGKTEDIANAISFLCSEDANFITGHGLVVDGGLSIQLQEDFGLRQAHYIKENPDADIDI
ncbi:MAG: SDR family NAD(P)-dependent oxidoreductase [Dehalococcoidia bacterium]